MPGQSPSPSSRPSTRSCSCWSPSTCGATATLAHTLAAFYLGFSLAYGHRVIAWADRWFAYRYAVGPRPERLLGRAYAKVCWGDVLRTGLALAISLAVVTVLRTWVGDDGRTAALGQAWSWAGIVMSVELLWAASYTLWPRTR